jgi:hypothetical protein
MKTDHQQTVSEIDAARETYFERHPIDPVAVSDRGASNLLTC